MDIEREFYQAAFDGNKKKYKELFKLLKPTIEMIELACFDAYRGYEPVMMKYIIDNSDVSVRYLTLYSNLIVSIKEVQRRHNEVMERRKSEPAYYPNYKPIHDKHLLN